MVTVTDSETRSSRPDHRHLSLRVPLVTPAESEDDLVPGSTEPAIVAQVPTEPPPDRLQRLRAFVANREVQRGFVNIAVILLIGIVVQVDTGKFFTEPNVAAIASAIADIVVIACAMTLVMVAGEIDVSVSGVVVLTQVIAGMLLVAGVPLIPAFVIATLVGGGVGLVNSYLVLVIKLPSLIATIGTLYVAQGVANIVTNGLPVAGVPNSFSTLGQGHIDGVPNAVPTMIIAVGLFLFIQRYTRLGRHIVAMGSNRQASFLNGVNTHRTLIYAFFLSGLAAGWGGIMYGSRVGVPIPTLDNNLLFYVIVAIVIGGANLTGGEGSVVGTLIGAILIGVINDGLDLMGIAVYWQFIALGVVLVLSVASDGYFRRDIFHRLPSGVRRTAPVPPSAGTPTGTSA